MRAARIASVLALAAGLVLAFLILLGGSSGHSYHVIFETGGQLVNGNQVLVAGQPVGTIDDITLTDGAQADVQITVDEPLRQGTTAVIRATSLSGIANRYISITPGPNNAPEMPDGGVLTADETTSPVDLDQLFNTFDKRTRTGLQDVIKGFAATYTGAGAEASKSYKYFAPGLSSTTRLLDEVTRDEQVLSEFLVQGSRLLDAVAQRREDLSSLTQNANEGLGAVAAQNEAWNRSLAALAPFMRQADTTFINLRSALDDLDPLVAASKPATKDLPEFLRRLRPVANRAVPVISDLSVTVNRGGAHNDLVDSLRELPKVERRAAPALANSTDALDASQDNVAFARPYMPDVLGFLTKFGQVTANYDANSHYARVAPANSNIFDYAGGALDPIPPSAQFDDLQFGIFKRCPGAATQPASDGSSPFLDRGNLTGLCDPADVPPGSFP